MRFLSALILFLQTFLLQAQPHVLRVHFVPTFAAEELELEKQYVTSTGDTVSVDNFRFYVSNFSQYDGEKLVSSSTVSPRLVDLNNPSSLTVEMVTPFNYNRIKFNLGIDSLTSVSGAMGGDLDATRGMYWAWQSGYINLKLEGKCNVCPTRNNVFEFHLGGYNGKQNALQTISLNTTNTAEITVEIPIDQFLSHIDLAKQNQVMVPGAEAVSLSRTFAQIFRLKTK